MKIIKKLGYTSLGLAALYIAYITGTGDILNYINFADPLNEMAFCIFAIMLSVICFVCALSNNEVECSKDLDWEWYNEQSF